MKLFLILLMVAVVVGSLGICSALAYKRIEKAGSSVGRAFWRLLSLALAVLTIPFVLYVVESNSAKSETFTKPNPIDKLNAQAREKASAIERPVLESKTHREYVRGATQPKE